MTLECDVLVVGGGPAGSSAARAAAKKGAKTILIEEHKEIGLPVECAEGIGKYLIPFLPFKIPPSQLKWEIKGMTFWANDILIERNGGIWAGNTINRTEWDQWLADLASKEGAQIKRSSKLIEFECNNDFFVKKAIVNSNNKKIEIQPKIVIAADGVKSTVVDLLNIKKKTKNIGGEIKSYEIKNLNISYPNHDQLFIGDFSPNSYGYIFPISKKRANVGIGRFMSSKDIDTLFQEFLEIPIVKKQVKNGVKVIEKNGFAPVEYRTDRSNYGNVLLVGDAANQNIKPFIEGNLPAIICGDIAGKLSYDIVKKKKDINNYRKFINKILGPMFKSSDEILKLMLEAFDTKNHNLLLLILASNIYSLQNTKNLYDKSEEIIQKKIETWKGSKFKKFKTQCIEKYYLLYLFLWRKSRLL